MSGTTFGWQCAGKSLASLTPGHDLFMQSIPLVASVTLPLPLRITMPAMGAYKVCLFLLQNRVFLVTMGKGKTVSENFLRM